MVDVTDNLDASRGDCLPRTNRRPGCLALGGQKTLPPCPPLFASGDSGPHEKFGILQSFSILHLKEICIDWALNL